MFDKKINMLKALAIMLVVSGHLEFSLIPMFPPYSFQVVLFFFISGMLYNDKYSVVEYILRKLKTLMFPYGFYCVFYLALTILFSPVIGKFWAMPITFKNEFVMPFLTGHQIDVISPMWFVPQLFCSLIVYKFIRKIKLTSQGLLIIFLAAALSGVWFAKYDGNYYVLLVSRTLFSLFFIHLGYFYQNKIRDKFNIFSGNIVAAVLFVQSLLWLANKDYTPSDGIGLSYVLAWGEFDDFLIPILTSLSGIYISLLIVEIFYVRLENSVIINKIGQNTYHIMANHLFVFNVITYILLYIKKIPFDIKTDIYWFYAPLKTTYLYFFLSLAVCTLAGETLKFMNKRLIRGK